MTPNKSLSGKRIVVTRTPDQARELVSALEAKGAEVLLFPLLSFAPPKDWHGLDDQLRRLDSFDAILFLSKNAVRYVFQRCRELGINPGFSPSNRPFVATVGHATGEAARREGWPVDYVAKNQTAESLARELRPLLAGRTVFLPRGDRGDSELPDALREVGAHVSEAIAYRTVAPENADAAMLERIRQAHVDALVFASPSAFQNLCDLIPHAEVVELSWRIRFAAIGPTTARALRKAGARVEIEASEPSAASLVAAITEHFESHGATARRR
jgi:uroporphyrinogen-III synthase